MTMVLDSAPHSPSQAGLVVEVEARSDSARPAAPTTVFLQPIECTSCGGPLVLVHAHARTDRPCTRATASLTCEPCRLDFDLEVALRPSRRSPARFAVTQFDIGLVAAQVAKCGPHRQRLIFAMQREEDWSPLWTDHVLGHLNIEVGE